MPNYMDNHLEFHDKKDCKRVSEFMKGEEGDFDFNKLIPMPRELRYCRSPMHISTNRIYYIESILKLTKEMKNPTPSAWESIELTRSKQIEFIKKFGHDNWYDWAIENWGTKWNAGGVKIDDMNIYFETAWAVPEHIVTALAKKFNNMCLLWHYEEEQGYGGTLEIANGQWLKTFMYDVPDPVTVIEEDDVAYCEIKGHQKYEDGWYINNDFSKRYNTLEEAKEK